MSHYPETVYQVPTSWGNPPKTYMTQRVMEESRAALEEMWAEDEGELDNPRKWTLDREEDDAAVYTSHSMSMGCTHRDEIYLTLDEIDDEIHN